MDAIAGITWYDDVDQASASYDWTQNENCSSNPANYAISCSIGDLNPTDCTPFLANPTFDLIGFSIDPLVIERDAYVLDSPYFATIAITYTNPTDSSVIIA